MDIVRRNQVVQLDHRSNKADFTFDWSDKDDNGNPINFTGAIFACAIYDNTGEPVLQVRSDDGSGSITINGTVLEFLLTQAQINRLCGTYGIGCTSLRGASITQVFIGTVGFYDGLALV